VAADAGLCEESPGLSRGGGEMVERPPFGIVMLATLIAGWWSVMSGAVLVMGLTALGLGH
jgi:hypothetical protein